jgi:hypothetical protein
MHPEGTEDFKITEISGSGILCDCVKGERKGHKGLSTGLESFIDCLDGKNSYIKFVDEKFYNHKRRLCSL